MNDLILFDIDKTLLDTPRLIQHYIWPAALSLTKASFENWQEKTLEYQATLIKYTDFDPDEYAIFMAKAFGTAPKKIQALFAFEDFFRASLYSETIPILTALSKVKTIGIFSEGKPYWQKRKLELSGIKAYIDQSYTFIARRKTTPEFLAQLPSESWIVDDNVTVITEVYQFGALKPIWLNRDDELIPTEFQALPIIKTLQDVPAVVGF